MTYLKKNLLLCQRKQSITQSQNLKSFPNVFSSNHDFKHSRLKINGIISVFE